jgi:carbonic anhydrase
MNYPFVAERVQAGELEINGARFGIADGKLEVFDRTIAAFKAI